MKKILLSLLIVASLASCKKKQDIFEQDVKHLVEISTDGVSYTEKIKAVSEVGNTDNGCLRFIQIDETNSRVKYERTICRVAGTHVSVDGVVIY